MYIQNFTPVPILAIWLAVCSRSKQLPFKVLMLQAMSKTMKISVSSLTVMLTESWMLSHVIFDRWNYVTTSKLKVSHALWLWETCFLWSYKFHIKSRDIRNALTVLSVFFKMPKYHGYFDLHRPGWTPYLIFLICLLERKSLEYVHMGQNLNYR